MKWLLTNPMAAFDSETTGVDIDTERIVTATVAQLMPGTPWAVDIQSWLIAPDVDIPEAATAVHGITTEFARKNGEPPAQALELIAYALARTMLARIPTVVANGAYDYSILDRELRRNDLPTLDERTGRPIGPVVDVMVIDKWIDPFRSGGRKLTDLCAFYSVKIDGAHDAAADALAAARIAFRIALRTQEDVKELTKLYAGWGRNKPAEIAARLHDLGTFTAADLHDAQVGWREEQMAGLRAYFERKGIKHDGCDPSWPMRPYAAPSPELVDVPLWGDAAVAS